MSENDEPDPQNQLSGCLHRSSLDGTLAQPAGGAVDLVSRALAARLSETLNQAPLVDFAPISIVTRSPLVLTARLSIEAQTIPELIALAKANPG